MPLFASRRIVLPLLCVAPLLGDVDAASCAEVPVSASDPVVAAIAQAVQARVGRGATVRVLELSGMPGTLPPGILTATPEPAARIGSRSRFVLLAAAQIGRRQLRVGEATALVEVTAPAVRARRAVVRGARLAAADVETTAVELSGQPLQLLPSLEQVLGSRARRDLDVDTVVTRADIAAEPLVRGGQVVRALARIDGAEIVGQLVAVDSGTRGDIVRVVNQDSRHIRRARVIGSGEVEIINVQ